MLRTFLRWSLLAVACASAQPAALDQVEPNLYLFRDACNVWVLREGPRAVLIDLGSGAVLDALAPVGITRVEAIYLTHRDRDQWFGFDRALESGIPIRAPAGSIRPGWSQILPLRNARFHEVYSVPARESDAIAADIADGAVLTAPGASLRALATPGHAPGHLAYLASFNGRRIAFTGDLIHSRGKVWQGYQLDWDHWLPKGLEAQFRSLLRLRDERPVMLLPSHGEVLRDGVEDSLTITADRVWRAARAKNFELVALASDPPIERTPPLRRVETVEIPTSAGGRPLSLSRLSKHLWVTGNNYFLLADNGACFAVDNNLPPELWKPILERIGASRVDFLWVTHIHFDHTRDLPRLKKLYGVQVLVVRELAGLLEQPDAWLQPYNAFEGIRPDRVLEDGEEFEWNGYRFRAHFAPGQTWFHAFLETTIDGRRAVFSGDSFFPVKDFDLANGTGGWSGLNRGFPLYHARSARLMLDIRPDWVLAEHDTPFLFSAREWTLRESWAREAARALDALSPSGNHLWDFNPHVFTAWPFISRGEAGRVELRVFNPFGEPMRVGWRAGRRAPAEIDPAEGEAVVPPQSERALALRYRLRAPAARGRHVVPIEITARGQYLGEAFIFLVDVP